MIEFDLRLPVAKWCLSRGMSPILECWCLRQCDIVGARFDRVSRKWTLVEMIAIELKLHDVGAVLKQCTRHRGHVNETWAAMPAAVANEKWKRFDGTGIGLLAVEGAVCEPLLLPHRFEGLSFEYWERPLGRRRDEYLWRMKDPQMLRSRAMAELRKENERDD